MLDTAHYLETGVVSDAPLRIYAGVLGQIGDIVMFTATARRLKELFPRSQLTFAVSKRYVEAGGLIEGLPYVDQLFVTDLYFERMNDAIDLPWHLGWPTDLRGDDEVVQQRAHDIVLETRPRHRRMPWWKYDHQVAELAHSVGVPGPIDLATEIAVPTDASVPTEARQKIVMHNDPAIDTTKAWPWELAEEFVQLFDQNEIVLLGSPGPNVPGTLDFRGRTTLAEAAAIIASSRCYVGIDSGLMWIASSLRVPVVGLYGTSYIAAYEAIQPRNPRAIYLQTEGTLGTITPTAVRDAVRQAMAGPATETAL
jgi:ADP-heptose:LPS heptosyltransferase